MYNTSLSPLIMRRAFCLLFLVFVVWLGTFLPTFSRSQEQTWGTLTGRIVWGGDKAPATSLLGLDTNADKKACTQNGTVVNDAWVIHPNNKGLKDVFLWLEPVPQGDLLAVHPSYQNVSADKPTIEARGCRFVPHALAVRQGQTVVFKNVDPIVHTFIWRGSREINPGSGPLFPPNEASWKLEGLRADPWPITVQCNLHPWMQGWIRVFDHPYFAVTGDDGSFQIRDAPAREVRLKIWHPKGGWLSGVQGKNGRPIRLEVGTTKLGDLVYPPPKDE